jgi:GNAT superfamily N-acetyltransferase
VADRFRIGWEWHELAWLPDGTAVLLRLLRPEDAPLLLEGFERLSPDSRYRRFLSAKPRLSDAELRYLTELDGVDHVAIAALDARGHGVGVARFVRLRDEPGVAEPALTVIDEAQHRGLGRLLLTRLAAAAREREIVRFRSTVLAENRPMRALLRGLHPDAPQVVRDGEVMVEIPVS